MIWESCYWKNDFLRDADIVERWSVKRPNQRQFALLEKKIMIAAYTIRKLSEAYKISDHLVSATTQVRCYNAIGSKVHVMNWHNVSRHYNLDNFSIKRLAWRFICNQIIHSFIFLLNSDHENGMIDGFLVSSDREKAASMYGVMLKDFC